MVFGGEENFFLTILHSILTQQNMVTEYNRTHILHILTLLLVLYFS